MRSFRGYYISNLSPNHTFPLDNPLSDWSLTITGKIVEFERYRAISRELLNAQTQDKYHAACSQEPEDSIDVNVLESSTCLKTIR